MGKEPNQHRTLKTKNNKLDACWLVNPVPITAEKRYNDLYPNMVTESFWEMLINVVDFLQNTNIYEGRFGNNDHSKQS